MGSKPLGSLALIALIFGLIVNFFPQELMLTPIWAQETQPTTPHHTEFGLWVELSPQAILERARAALLAAGMILHDPLGTAVGGNDNELMAILSWVPAGEKCYVRIAVAGVAGQRERTIMAATALRDYMASARVSDAGSTAPPTRALLSQCDLWLEVSPEELMSRARAALLAADLTVHSPMATALGGSDAQFFAIISWVAVGQRHHVNFAVAAPPGERARAYYTATGLRNSMASGQVQAPPNTPIPPTILPKAPTNMMGYRRQYGKTYSFTLTGAAKGGGSIWGTDVYTDDSMLVMAAVHAGILKDGQQGVVTVRILPGRDKYIGSTRNGVTSNKWDKHEASYEFVR